MGRWLERRRRGALGWLGALLGASLLTSCCSATGAKIRVTWEPSKLSVGGNVTLTPGGKDNFGFCIWSRWYRVEKYWILIYFPPPNQMQTNGPRYTGRETAGPNCSLHVRNLRQWDSGRYTVHKLGNHFTSEIGQALIKVNAPFILSKREICGIVIAALVGAMLLRYLLYYCFPNCRKKKARKVVTSSLLSAVPAKRPMV